MLPLRAALRASNAAWRQSGLILAPRLAALPSRQSPSPRRGAAAHAHAETYEAFNARYIEFFNNLEDPFELMRGLNNCFIYDLVPSQEVIEAALRACRRCNDYALAVRIFDALKDKTETKAQYEAYVRETEPLRKELGLLLADDLYERECAHFHATPARFELIVAAASRGVYLTQVHRAFHQKHQRCKSWA